MERVVKINIVIIFAIFLISCGGERERNAVSIYEVEDGSSALYLSNGRFIAGGGFVLNDEFYRGFPEISSEIEYDKFGCKVLDGLTFPSSFEGLRCEGVTFRVRDEGGASYLEGSDVEGGASIIAKLGRGGEVEWFLPYPGEVGAEKFFHKGGKYLSIE